MDEVGNNYIGEAFTSLFATLGVKEYFVPDKALSLLRERKVREAIREIAEYLGLPIEVKLSYAPKGYRPNATDGFQSSQLVKTDWRGRGTGGITAQVSIPADLPIYDSSRMVNFPISIRISEGCTDEPMTFISVMAHELCHIVLYSLLHKEKENEFYTDVATMLLGFADVMKTGRKVVKSNTFTSHGFLSTNTTTTTQTTTYGYLSDDNFTFVFAKIEKALQVARASKGNQSNGIKKLEGKLQRQKEEIFYFRNYLEYVDRNLTQRISPQDGHLIAGFHQADYTAEFEAALSRMTKELSLFRSFLLNLRHYNQHSLDKTKKYEAEVHAFATDLAGKYHNIQGAVAVLKKYVSTMFRLQTFFKVKSAGTFKAI